MVNVPLLEQVMQHIEDRPETHYQPMFFRKDECGTAACFAGWACLLSGYEPIFGFKMNWGYHDRSWYVETPAGTVEARLAAADVLDIPEQDAEILFDAHNSRDHLKLMVKDLANGENLRTPHEWWND